MGDGDERLEEWEMVLKIRKNGTWWKGYRQEWEMVMKGRKSGRGVEG